MTGTLRHTIHINIGGYCAPSADRGDKDARSSVRHAASRATSFSKNCSTSVDMIGKPDGLICVMPGVLRTKDVVRKKVAQAIAAPKAEATGFTDPIIKAAAVVSSIVPTILASPPTPNTLSQLINGLCAIKCAMASAA